MISSWGQFRDYINSKEIGYVFTRSEVKAAYTGYGNYTADNYRNLLCRSKFLSHVARGKYKLDNYVPEGLTLEEAMMLANGDNLSYIENLHKRRERAKLIKNN